MLQRRNLDKEFEIRSITPEMQPSTTAFMQHQQALLFNNAKPGENIKISDILRQT